MHLPAATSSADRRRGCATWPKNAQALLHFAQLTRSSLPLSNVGLQQMSIVTLQNFAQDPHHRALLIPKRISTQAAALTVAAVTECVCVVRRCVRHQNHPRQTSPRPPPWVPVWAPLLW